MKEYRADYDRFTAQLSAALAPPPTAPNFAALRKKISGDFPAQYRTWDLACRRTFWREIIKKIVIDCDNIPKIFFV